MYFGRVEINGWEYMVTEGLQEHIRESGRGIYPVKKQKGTVG
jgi:hypothetical protein